jgi:hypothetical protein
MDGSLIPVVLIACLGFGLAMICAVLFGGDET